MSKDLSAQIKELNDLLDGGQIDEAEYDKRASPLFKLGEMIQYAKIEINCLTLSYCFGPHDER